MLKLIYSPTSPYARKVRMTAIECGLQNIETIADNPMESGSNVHAINPLGKVPALILEDHRVMIDSPVICEYLDQHDRVPTLVPPSGPERYEVLMIQALADGIIDSAVSLVMEKRRPSSEQSALWLGRWEAAIQRTLPSLEERVISRERFDLGALSSVVALLYLEFRLSDHDFLKMNPPLAQWLHPYRSRTSVLETAPPDS